MKKIGVFLHSVPGVGGIFQYNQSMLNALSTVPTDQYEVVAAYTQSEWLPYLNEANIPSVQLPKLHWAQELGKRWREKGLSYSLWKELTGDIHPVGMILKEQQCDIWLFPSQDSYSFQLDVPVLGTVHDLMHRYESHFPEVSGESETAYREWLYSNMLEQAKGILVDSEIGKQHVMECYGVNPDKVFVQPYIAPAYIYKAEQQFDAILKPHPELPEKYLFYPAQFWQHKNHQSIVEAVHMLNDEGIRIHFVFVGTNTEAVRAENYNNLIGLIEKYSLQDQFTFLGYVDDKEMPGLYRHARGLVMPTFFGPTNIPPLEAFVMECPVAISRIYAMPDQLEDAALFFDPKSVSELADCIRTLWTNDQVCEELIEKGRQKACNWGQEQFRDHLLSIVEQLT